jgi:PHD/YefM family antitoxin component YafN of YafNO toxin-antitoxin module
MSLLYRVWKFLSDIKIISHCILIVKYRSVLQAWYYYGTIKPQKGADIMPRIIPIRDLKNTAAVSQMCSESKEPVYITKNGYGDMVIMSMEAYEEKMQLLDAYAKLDAAEQQVEAGQTQDARSALQELRARYGI